MNRICQIVPLLTLLFVLPTCATAGQGPQNVAVIINQRSPLSVAVARHYVQLRGIPTCNLIYLDWDRSPVGTDVETFRTNILQPILQAIEKRGLGAQITTIAYSSDFPYVIDYKVDLKEDSRVDPTAKQFHQGSLTGLTYLAPLVLAKDVENYTNLASNYYYRPSLMGKLLSETRDFPSGSFWNQQGALADMAGRRYYLSTMLAYTSGRGNSFAEVQAYLEGSARADGTYPAGKIYFLTNADVRSKTRAPQFKPTIAQLEQLGVAAEIVDGNLPRGRLDVMGAMIGTVDYRFAESGSQVQGGAICENLTSFGGVLRENGGQTALTECLRAGSAGSSGTVTEPYAIQAKFPHPFVHVHYARGCCLAEAFYQAVQGPYQLLIIGDPLARPWATIPHLTVVGIDDGRQLVQGELRLAPAATTVSGKQVSEFQLFVDGQRLARCGAGESLTIDTRQWPEGEHELRVIGFEDSAIATQGEWIRRIVVQNQERDLPLLNLKSGSQVFVGQALRVEASAPQAKQLSLFLSGRRIATADGAAGNWELTTRELGIGRAALQVVASYDDAAQDRAFSTATLVELLPAELPAQAEPVAAAKPGLRLLREGKEPTVIERLTDQWLVKAGVEPGEKIRLEGLFRSEAPVLYQWQLDAGSDVEMRLNDQPLMKRAKGDSSAVEYAVVTLAAGVHRLEVSATVDQQRRLMLSGGDCGTQAVAAGVFFHVE